MPWCEGWQNQILVAWVMRWDNRVYIAQASMSHHNNVLSHEERGKKENATTSSIGTQRQYRWQKWQRFRSSNWRDGKVNKWTQDLLPRHANVRAAICSVFFAQMFYCCARCCMCASAAKSYNCYCYRFYYCCCSRDHIMVWLEYWLYVRIVRIGCMKNKSVTCWMRQSR